DGIRDRNVTGVQTCALPILTRTIFAVMRRGTACFIGAMRMKRRSPTERSRSGPRTGRNEGGIQSRQVEKSRRREKQSVLEAGIKIGRASCRERGERGGGGGG